MVKSQLKSEIQLCTIMILGSLYSFFIFLVTEFNQTMLIVTHDKSFAQRTQHIIEMEDGKIIN